MNVLVIGNGGREHAICTALKKSPKVNKIYAIAGNAGIGQIAECHEEISVMDFPSILRFLEAHKDIALTVVAPDDPLAQGLVDLLESAGHRAFGPKKEAAIIESSKSFSKRLMKKYNIPTAAYEEFTQFEAALEYVKNHSYPLVVKADGLALGKGVIICQNKEEAEQALSDMLLSDVFHGAGKKVIIEEFMTGKEVTVLAFTDGKTIVPMVSSQDHKRAFDNDEGLNTGGMGTFSPSKAYTSEMEKEAYDKIFMPTIAAMNAEGRTFKGVLYFGLMITQDGLKVVEYNARFGDPEAQVVLPRLKTDLLEIMEAVIDGRLCDVKIEWNDLCTVCVILASGGYPKSYRKSLPIDIGKLDEDIILYHAGTKYENGKLVTAGGRVMGVTAMGKTMQQAREKAYRNIEKIKFDGMHFRKDIGIKL